MPSLQCREPGKKQINRTNACRCETVLAGERDRAPGRGFFGKGGGALLSRRRWSGQLKAWLGRGGRARVRGSQVTGGAETHHTSQQVDEERGAGESERLGAPGLQALRGRGAGRGAGEEVLLPVKAPRSLAQLSRGVTWSNLLLGCRSLRWVRRGFQRASAHESRLSSFQAQARQRAQGHGPSARTLRPQAPPATLREAQRAARLLTKSADKMAQAQELLIHHPVWGP